MPADAGLVAAARAGLRERADPGQAAGMQAYMKSSMPYRGARAADMRAVGRSVLAEHPLGDWETWRDTILALWREAAFREERYVALELAMRTRYRSYQLGLDSLPLYEELIVTGAWWDLVDGVASHLLGGLLRAHPDAMRAVILAWSRSDDMWKRRSAIISQLGSKAGTDLELLYACIAPNLADREFFIRKAIGWALRQLAWTNPEAVRRYVQAHEGQLSGLSKREALKNVDAVSHPLSC